MVWAVSATPTVVLGKVSEVGEGLTIGLGTVPPPERATVCGDPLALSATLTAAESAPAAVGVNLTVMVQEAAPARLAPQLLVSVKEVALVPVMVIPLIVNGSVPVFLSVTVCVGSDVPTRVLAKVSDVGERLATGATAVAYAATRLATFIEPRPVARSKPTVEE